MKLRSGNFLGISVSDRTIVCAEVALTGARRVVRESAEFAVPPGLSLPDNPDAVGEALKSFLRERRFTASRAVVGVPARWLIALEKDVPPAAEEQAKALLRLQAERLAVAENGDMVFDFAGEADAARATKVLLVGMQRQRVDAVERMLAAAGVDVVAITSSALALAKGATGAGGRDRPMLLLGRQGAEMVWRHEGSPRMLRHVSVSATNGHGPVSVGPLGLELSRAVALTRINGATTASELMLWDAVGLSAAQVDELAERTGLAVRSADARKELGVESVNGQTGTADSIAPALALAVAGADRGLLPIDFKHSRLTPRKQPRVGRKTLWGAVIGAVVVLGTAALYFDVRSRETELTRLTGDLKAHASQFKAAENMVGRVNYSRGFFDTRPPYLDCMAELTKAFPTRDNEQIWVSTMTLRENRRGQIQGKAQNNETVRTVLEALKRNAKFTAVQLMDLRDAGGRTREVTFSIGFTYIAVE